MSWYYTDNSQQTKGPITETALKSLFKKGSITKDTFVWNGSTVNDWVAISTVDNILPWAKPGVLVDMERRYSPDGTLYTQAEFRDWFGQGSWRKYWDNAPPERRRARDGNIYTRKEFIEWFGQSSWQNEWDNAMIISESPAVLNSNVAGPVPRRTVNSNITRTGNIYATLPGPCAPSAPPLPSAPPAPSQTMERNAKAKYDVPPYKPLPSSAPSAPSMSVPGVSYSQTTNYNATSCYSQPQTSGMGMANSVRKSRFSNTATNRPAPLFAPGQRVRISGLIVDRTFNGQYGTLARYLPGRQRWEVRMDMGRILTVEKGCLRHVVGSATPVKTVTQSFGGMNMQPTYVSQPQYTVQPVSQVVYQTSPATGGVMGSRLMAANSGTSYVQPQASVTYTSSTRYGNTGIYPRSRLY